MTEQPLNSPKQLKGKKTAPSFDVGTRRSRAESLVLEPIENPTETAAHERKTKVFKRFMEMHQITSVDEIEIKRLNCEIPKELHTWLNLHARSGTTDYSSMTEIVIDLLSEYAAKQGFKVKK